MNDGMIYTIISPKKQKVWTIVSHVCRNEREISRRSPLTLSSSYHLPSSSHANYENALNDISKFVRCHMSMQLSSRSQSHAPQSLSIVVKYWNVFHFFLTSPFNCDWRTTVTDKIDLCDSLERKEKLCKSIWMPIASVLFRFQSILSMTMLLSIIFRKRAMMMIIFELKSSHLL